MNDSILRVRPKMNRRVGIIAYRIFFVILLSILLLISSCQNFNKNSQDEALNLLCQSNKPELVHQVPLKFDTYHVQGLDITDQFYFVTSVDTKENRAWLFKIDRQNAGLVFRKELTDGALIHPGGLQHDGRYIWVPNAEYRRQSRTMIYGLDPDSLEIRTSFSIDDHIGAVASDGKNFLYGVNWDALQFYKWDMEGSLLQKLDSPTSMAYQDIKYFGGRLLCSGHKGDVSAIDIIDPEKWTLIKRINLPKDKWKTTLTREGMAFDGKLYFLPDDGPDSCILIFGLN